MGGCLFILIPLTGAFRFQNLTNTKKGALFYFHLALVSCVFAFWFVYIDCYYYLDIVIVVVIV